MSENKTVQDIVNNRKITKIQLQLLAEELNIKVVSTMTRKDIIENIVSCGFENRLYEVFENDVSDNNTLELNSLRSEIERYKQEVEIMHERLKQKEIELVKAEREIKALTEDKKKLVKELDKNKKDLIIFNNWRKNVGKGGRKAIFTNEEKHKIRVEYMQGMSIRGLAKKYKCSSTLIHNILHDKC